MTFPKQRQAGFTLVELAIVLMIIGLLIGGVLRGQELMNNARISSTIQQVTAYSGAALTFLDSYQALPGDMPTAQNRVPGCTAANFCTNGNGNGSVGLNTASAIAGMQLSNDPIQRETIMFWKHLAMSHLISGINPSANPAVPEWGGTHPAAKLRGGFHILYSPGQATSSSSVGRSSGHYLRLQAALTGSSPFVGGAGVPNEAVTPKEAWQIDTKMDDGRPDFGAVMSDDRAGGASACEGSAYDPREETALCIMYFQIL